MCAQVNKCAVLAHFFCVSVLLISFFCARYLPVFVCAYGAVFICPCIDRNGSESARIQACFAFALAKATKAIACHAVLSSFPLIPGGAVLSFDKDVFFFKEFFLLEMLRKQHRRR